MKSFIAAIAAAALLAAASPAVAQSAPDYRPGAAVTQANPQPVRLRCWNGTAWADCTLSGGGGSGDASAANQATQITAANLTNTRLGDITTPAAGSVNARLEAMRALLAGTLTIGLPSGAATAANQATGNASLGSIDGKLPASLGAKASNASLSVAPATDAVFVADTVIRAAPANRGASVGTTAVTLAAANSSRRGFAVQNQSTTASCYVSTIGTATADFNALWIGPGAFYETPSTHTSTGAISVICTAAATPVYAREW